jgi:hypothetical protein
VIEACLSVQVCQAQLLCPVDDEVWGRVTWRSGVVAVHEASGSLVVATWRAWRQVGSLFWLGVVIVCGGESEALLGAVQDCDFGPVRSCARESFPVTC